MEPELSISQRQLLLDNDLELLYSDISKAISVALKNGKQYHIYLTYSDIEELLGHVCFLANHEKERRLSDRFDNLADYLEDCLAEFK